MSEYHEFPSSGIFELISLVNRSLAGVTPVLLWSVRVLLAVKTFRSSVQTFFFSALAIVRALSKLCFVFQSPHLPGTKVGLKCDALYHLPSGSTQIHWKQTAHHCPFSVTAALSPCVQNTFFTLSDDFSGRLTDFEVPAIIINNDKCIFSWR